MAYTSQKRLAAMMREVRDALGLRSIKEAWEAYQRVSQLLNEAGGFSLSPYKDGVWTLSCFRDVAAVGQCAWHCEPVGVLEFMSDPEGMAARYLAKWPDTPREALAARLEEPTTA